MATPAELAELIADDIAAALAQPDHSMRMTELRAAAAIAFAIAFDDAMGPEPNQDEGVAYEIAEAEFLNTLNAAAAMTFPDDTDAQLERVTSVFATAAANAATVAASPGGEFTWITMLDDKVRETHQPLHGEVRAAGQPFIVGGFPLFYPGQPVGPPEIWINCRCHLNATPLTAAGDDNEGAGSALAVEDGRPPVQAAGVPGEVEMDPDLTAASDTPWSQFSAADYTIEQWRRACTLTMPGGDPESKSTYKLPIREPSGALNVNGVHAAASRFGSTHAPAEAKAKAAAKIRGAYRQLGETPPDSLKADAALDDELLAVNTRDGPGWLTNPRETQRLRNYWTRGAGAAKIRWGSPNDLTRCHKYLSKYVAPPFVWGTCQNLHHTALGHFNPESRGRRGGGEPDEVIDAIDAAFVAAARLEDEMDAPTMLAPPLEWFQDPGFDAATPLTITTDGRVLGHLAAWETCHVGITGECVTPPHSQTNYAHFRTGEIETREGELVAVGQITMDTGHADRGDGPQATVAHYDDTGTGVADVVAGEDEFGIWVAGAMRPGVSEQQLYVLKATGALSGDWRRIGGNLELVAALAVNVPGFPIPRVAMAASASGQPLSLVAAAVVALDPNALDTDRIVLAVGRALDEREAARDRAVRAERLAASVNPQRVERLLALVEG